MIGTPGEPAEVWLRDGRPARFGWRGRIYTVMLVVDHDGECWRVEATPARSVPPEVYVLCHEPEADEWTLAFG